MLASLVPSRGDLFGGISAGIVALPLCLAFGAISGLGPEAGLYGAIAAGILAAIFGGSQVLVTGPTNPMTLVAATVVAANTPPGGTINLPVVMAAFLLAGALQVLLGVLRLGGFVRYVPYPVISGFMSGIGVIIIIQQLYPIVGAEAPSSNAVVILGSLSMLPESVLWPVALLGLVPRHRGFDRLGVTENGQVLGGEEHLDAARDAWLAADVAEALQREDHLVHGRRRAELEMALHVGLGRGTAVDAGIGVDEGQVLPLLRGEAFRGHRHTIDSSTPLATERQNEHTLSGRAERSRAF